jgi:hypothetical protein
MKRLITITTLVFLSMTPDWARADQKPRATSFDVEVISSRVGAGNYGGTLQLGFGTFTWRSFYLTAARLTIGGGAKTNMGARLRWRRDTQTDYEPDTGRRATTDKENTAALLSLGMSLGGIIRLHQNGRHQLRMGVAFAIGAAIGDTWEPHDAGSIDAFEPGFLGLMVSPEVAYLHKPHPRGYALEIGLMSIFNTIDFGRGFAKPQLRPSLVGFVGFRI